ncbi:zinc-ribbon domain-containing protein [Streptomyces sp. WMMB 322]|uniref:zinc-ribbon domain-containing protein n=1 Tax=Streptomyces sp. WMMB 322 TaxID=1286821 RepID=UPI0006E4254A|nr:zinc ribbon domain-containing protein [Streptomyces sp. WMMB 322]SCK33539.1 zinc-ribbon family protein [Streptomyces sp. WMMB 322]
MLIFGTSTKMHQLAMLNLLCGFCGNPAAHSLRKRVMKFSLFFIPLFPIAPAKHYLQCTFCGGSSETTKENAEQLLAHGGGAPQPGGTGGPQAGYGAAQPGQAPHIPPQGNPFAGQNPQGGQPPQNPYQS